MTTQTAPDGDRPAYDMPFTTEDVDEAARYLTANRRLNTEGPPNPAAIARCVLTSAASRGRLLRSGGKTVTQWSVVFVDGFRAKSFDEPVVRLWLADPQARIAGPMEMRRITMWPDGSSLRGPWEVAR